MSDQSEKMIGDYTIKAFFAGLLLLGAALSLAAFFSVLTFAIKAPIAIIPFHQGATYQLNKIASQMKQIEAQVSGEISTKGSLKHLETTTSVRAKPAKPQSEQPRTRLQPLTTSDDIHSDT